MRSSRHVWDDDDDVILEPEPPRVLVLEAAEEPPDPPRVDEVIRQIRADAARRGAEIGLKEILGKLDAIGEQVGLDPAARVAALRGAADILSKHMLRRPIEVSYDPDAPWSETVKALTIGVITAMMRGDVPPKLAQDYLGALDKGTALLAVERLERELEILRQQVAAGQNAKVVAAQPEPDPGAEDRPSTAVTRPAWHGQEGAAK